MPPYKLKCVICGKVQQHGITEKYQIREEARAEQLLTSARFLQDDVYTRICDLPTAENILSADLFYHNQCLNKYIRKYKTQSAVPAVEEQEKIPVETSKTFVLKQLPVFLEIIHRGNGIALSEIRDYIIDKENIFIKNQHIKTVLEEHCGDDVQFCDSERKNESSMVFSSEINITDVVNIVRYLDSIKSAAKAIREALLKVDFGLEDKFCDAEELRHSWCTTRMLDELISFFSVMFNIKKTTLLKLYHNGDNSEDIPTVEQEMEDEKLSTKATKIGSLFQIMIYNIHNGRQRTPLHIMSTTEIYETCKSRELITSFNKSGLYAGYNTMKRHRTDLAKYAVVSGQEKERNVTLPSHFSPSRFTIAALDNFDHPDKNTLSGNASAHDTAITVFQEKTDKPLQKPLKSEVYLRNVTTLKKLPCQELIEYAKPKDLKLQESFSVAEDIFRSEKKLKDHEQTEFIMSCVQSQNPHNNVLPTWAGMRSLLSNESLTLFQVGFLPFIPHPVTEYSTVYTAMRNFVCLARQLDQTILPIFCDEGVFRIVLEIFLACPDEFNKLLPMLGGFHMAKCVEHCIGKFVRGCGLEDSLLETVVFGEKVLESVLCGTNYVRALRGLLILQYAIENVKWKAFWKEHNVEDHTVALQDIDELRVALIKKKAGECQEHYKDCSKTVLKLQQQYKEFIQFKKEKSEVCQHWEVLLNMIKKLKMLIASDRNGDWEGHLQAVQDLLPVFCESDSFNYLRYGS